MITRKIKESAPSNEDPIFMGEFIHKVDRSHRVRLPVKWDLQAGDTLTAVLWHHYSKDNACLQMLTEASMAKMQATITSMPDMGERGDVLRRALGANSESLRVGSEGKITLPERLMQSAGITTEVVLIGMMDFFQIWEPKRYKEVLARDNEGMNEVLKKISI